MELYYKISIYLLKLFAEISLSLKCICKNIWWTELPRDSG